MEKHGTMMAGQKAPRPRSGTGAADVSALKLWISIMLAEVAIMAAATPFAIWLAESKRYGTAATVLISSTLIAGGLVFALWRKLHLAKVVKLAEERRLAERKRREAEAQAQQKSRQLATMSHEIRTPLNGVIGMLGLMLETELSAEQKNYAGIAHGSARSLLSFLDEILDTAKGEALAASRSGPFELHPFIESITELMAPRAHAKGIDLSALVQPGMPAMLDMDQQKLRQILFNLVGNAIKFTEKGGVEITVNRAGTADLAITIRDTGIGMTPDELSRIFGDYTQANEQTSRRFGGTGLGLAISKGLVQSMGGRLEVQSNQGEGTRFTAVFPDLLKELGEESAKPLAGRHYGIAAEEGIVTQHLCYLLISLGATVEKVTAETISSRPAFLSGLVVDSHSGRALAAARREDRSLQQLPVWVLLTPEERRAMHDLLGMPNTGYLVKPLRFSSLVARLTQSDQSVVAASVEDLRTFNTSLRQLPKLRLLVVDDTPVNLLLARTLLSRNGHDVETAMSGVGMISLLERGETFDCVLLDVEMPGLNGYDTARKLRELEAERKWPRIPVIALTANSSPEDKAKCLASGMDGHLAKPFDQHDLMEILGGITSRRAA
jgi:signal transduction histidine kinase/CheY-like chemotaxis protein